MKSSKGLLPNLFLVWVCLHCMDPCESLVNKIKQVTQSCDSGGSVKFGIPWPSTEKPLRSFSVAFDGRPEDKISLDGGVKLSNIASPNMETTQSSTDNAKNAAFAVDGDETATSCTSTTLEVNPWWRIDLGTEEFIHSVRAVDCADECCRGGLQNMEVYVNNVGPLEINSANGFLAFSQSSRCGASSSVTAGGQKNVTCARRGRYVTIRLVREGALSLQEVQIFRPGVQSSSSANAVTFENSRRLFMNVLRSSSTVSSSRGDGGVNTVTCPSGTQISFGMVSESRKA